MSVVAPVVDAEYKKEIEKACRELRALISRNGCAPQMLRLAWHDARTYDAERKTGGANGSIRNLKNLDSSLKEAIDFCEEVKKKVPKISYADLYQLAGVAAVWTSGGPNIEFVPGRKDSLESSEEESFLEANQGAEGLRKIFKGMGLNDQDIVALSRVYTFTLRRTHPDKSVFVEARIRKPLEFNKSYFVELQKLSREEPKKETSVAPPAMQPQVNEPVTEPAAATDESGETIELHIDKALVGDPKFCHYVDLYAKDEDEFLKDYAKSHKKLSELGFIQPSSASKDSSPAHKKPLGPKSPSPSAGSKNPKVTTIGAVGIVIAATVVLLNYLYKGTK